MSRERVVAKTEENMCTPFCKFFRCKKKALLLMKKGRNPVAWCKWAMDNCIGPNCTFAFCIKHALREDKLCGLKVRREVKETKPEKEEREPVISERLKQKIKKRLRREWEEYL